MGKSVKISNVPNAPAFKANSNVISVPSGLVSATVFTSWLSEDFDTAAAFNTSNGRFQPTTAGYYQINGLVSYASNSVSGTYVSCDLLKNGAIASSASVPVDPVAYPRITHSDIFYLNGSTDYIQIGTMHNGASTATGVTAILSGALIRPA